MPPIPTPDSYPGIAGGRPIYAGKTQPAGPLPPGPGVLLTVFSLENWDTSNPTPVLFRGGMPFKKGDVPAGWSVEIRAGDTVVAAQFDERSTWSDGSLKFAVCHMRDANIPASGTRAYSVYAKNAAFDNTGTTSLATVAAAEALTVEVASLSQWNGTTSATRGAGAAMASFAEHAGVPTRVTKIHSGPVCDGWQVWGMFKDGVAGTGAEDVHLKAIWYVDVWKDAAGNAVDLEYGAVLAQDWWGVAGKFRLDYSATIKRNGATVQTYAGIQHPYHAQWATVRTADDNNHAKRHWKNGAPTLTYKFDKNYWVRTGVIPMFDTAYTPEANLPATYVPLTGIRHREDIDASGGYEGRGMLSNYDAKAFMRQTAFDNRAARTNAFAGLHIPQHYRDERTRTRYGELADVANTLVPTLLDPKPVSAATFDGLPSPKYTSSDGRSSFTYTGGFEPVAGGTGVWQSTADAAHAVPYSTYAYLLEGERYMLESVIDMATKSMYANVANEQGSRPRLQWYENDYARAEMSIPSAQWSGISSVMGQERSLGFSLLLLGYAACLSPSSDPSSGYLRAWNAHHGDFFASSLMFMPPSLKMAGALWNCGSGSAREIKSPWMIGFAIQGCAQNYLSTEVSSFRDFGDMMTRSLLGLKNRSLYDIGVYRSIMAPKRGTYAADNPWFHAAEVMVATDGTVSENRLTVSAGQLKYSIQDGDIFKFSASNQGFALGGIPPEYAEQTHFYAVEAFGDSCGLSLTPGGSAVALTAGNYTMGYRCFGGGSIAEATFPPYLPNADSYHTIAEATWAYAETTGMPSVPSGTFSEMANFNVNVSRASYPAWKLIPI